MFVFFHTHELIGTTNFLVPLIVPLTVPLTKTDQHCSLDSRPWISVSSLGLGEIDSQGCHRNPWPGVKIAKLVCLQEIGWMLYFCSIQTECELTYIHTYSKTSFFFFFFTQWNTLLPAVQHHIIIIIIIIILTAQYLARPMLCKRPGEMNLSLHWNQCIWPCFKAC